MRTTGKIEVALDTWFNPNTETWYVTGTKDGVSTIGARAGDLLTALDHGMSQIGDEDLSNVRVTLEVDADVLANILNWSGR